MGLGWVSVAELDQLGLSQALKLGARRAVLAVQARGATFTEVIIDGTINFLAGTSLEKYVTTLPKADFLIKEVSAASIVAKVARDNYMADLAEIFPGYGFESHVGYGTAKHRAAIMEQGITPEHRQSFKPIAELMGNNLESSTHLGRQAEQLVAEYLSQNGHLVLACNYRTKFYEIDIISQKDQNIYFTEVKYRKTAKHGSGMAAVTKQKLKQMRFAAEAFLSYHHTNLTPKLAVASVSDNFQLDNWLVLAE